jgi:hypothetical protein
MRRSIFVLVLFLLPANASATGWNDFQQPIDDGYTIFRANASDVGLSRDSGGVIVHATRGPLVAFAVTPVHIFTKHSTTEGSIFYVVDKATAMPTGPFSSAAFSVQPDVVQAGQLTWQVPTNPHPEVARDGQLMFTAYMTVFCGTPILLFLVGVFLVVRWANRRKIPG